MAHLASLPCESPPTVYAGRANRGRRGAAIVESALVLPLVIMFLFGILEYGRYVMTLQIVTNAAREGARYAVEHTTAITISGTTYNNGTSDVTNVVNNAMAGQSLASQSVSVYMSDTLGNNLGTWTNAQAGNSICVMDHRQLRGDLGSHFVTCRQRSRLRPQAVMRSEST